MSIKVLEDVGEWMRLNGESVYGCGIANIPKHDFGRITKGEDALYLYIQDCCSEYVAVYDCPYEIIGARLLCDGRELSMAEPWNVHSYEMDGHSVIFVRTPPFAKLNGNGNVVKLIIKK